jgi:hypothetical protein
MQSSSEVYRIISHINMGLSEGHSISTCLLNEFERRSSVFWLGLQSLNRAVNRDLSVKGLKDRFNHPHQQVLIELVYSGLLGQPVYEKLKDLEALIYSRDIAHIDKHQKLLPYKVMLPVFLLIVPGYFLLLFSFLFNFVSTKGF